MPYVMYLKKGNKIVGNLSVGKKLVIIGTKNDAIRALSKAKRINKGSKIKAYIKKI